MDITSYIMGSIAGAKSASGLKYLVVDELPTTGEEGTIYLVPKEDSQTDNVYNEYMYIEDEWELIGDTQADLTDYVKNTDYATTQKGGVIRTDSEYNGVLTDQYGNLAPNIINYSTYLNKSNWYFISKGTLENVIDGKGLITQYSTIPTASADNLGKIVQFTGTTDSTYTNGYFYQCVSDGQDPATYSWQNIEVQASGGSSAPTYIEDGNGGRMYIAKYSTDSTYQQNTLIPILQELLTHSNYSLYLDGGNAQNYDHYTETYYGGIYKLSNNLTNSATFSCITPIVQSQDLSNLGYTNVWKRQTNIRCSKTSGNITSITFNKTDVGIFSGVGTNTYYEKPYNPTQAQNPAPKKYVDDTSKITLYTQSGLTEYNKNSTYNTGDYCYYSGAIYKCNDDSITGAWDSTKWDSKTYMQYLSDTLVGTALGGSY